MLALVLLLLVGVVVGQGFGPYNVTSKAVSFVSSAPSGTLNLVGTLTLPADVTTPVPAVILLPGSGIGQRNETIVYSIYNFVVSPPVYPSCGVQTVELSVFVEIAEYLSSYGYAVLRFDKRACVQGAYPGCTYPLCPLNETNPPSNCLNYYKFTNWDQVLDVNSAIQFLANTEGVDGKNISLIGHSEGCFIAPYSAYQNQEVVQKVVLLAGIGLPLTDVVIEQLAGGVQWAATMLDVCIVEGASQDTIQALEKSLLATEATLQETAQITPFVLNGTYKDTDLVTWVGSTVPVGYILSAYEMGLFQNLYSIMRNFTQGGGSILSVNSPTDFQVQPRFYQPLHAALLSLPTAQNVEIVDDLTHVLTPADFSSGQVSTELLGVVLQFISD